MGKNLRYSRDKIFSIGAIIHLIAFVLIAVDLPNNSPLYETKDSAILKHPSAILALFCSFLLGFGDSIVNTQLISCLSSLYKSDSISAFAIFKFTQVCIDYGDEKKIFFFTNL